MSFTHFEELPVWQKARELCRIIYETTSNDQFRSDFRFRDQIRSVSGSIMDNVAERFERGGNKEFLQFLFISKGSCAEVRSQVYRAIDCNYITQLQADDLLERTERLSKELQQFINYLRNSDYKGHKYK